MFAVMFEEKVMFKGSFEECHAYWSACYEKVNDFSDFDDFDFEEEEKEERCIYDEFEIVEL